MIKSLYIFYSSKLCCFTSGPDTIVHHDHQLMQVSDIVFYSGMWSADLDRQWHLMMYAIKC